MTFEKLLYSSFKKFNYTLIFTLFTFIFTLSDISGKHLKKNLRKKITEKSVILGDSFLRIDKIKIRLVLSLNIFIPL